MKKLFFMLIITVLSVFYDSSAQAQNGSGKNNPCEIIIPSPKIEFSTSYGKLVYDFNKNLQELTELGKTYGIIEQGLFASGLAVVGVNWELSLNSVSRIIGDYDICVIPTNINIYIGYQDPIIYISNDLRPNTCNYNVVLRHEQTHHQINKAALEYFIPRLREAISQIIRDIRPVHIDSSSKIDAATNELTDEYIAKIEPLIDNFKQELLKEQGKLDNHTNYKMEGDLCKYVNKRRN